MKQEELDEISNAFQDAWTEYFGDEMYYVPFCEKETKKDDLYLEQKTKVYDYENKKMFHGTLRETPAIDELRQTGKKIRKEFEISFVTKELVDQGIKYVNTNDIILYIDRFGTEFRYKIYDEFQKVQFSDNKIFTKLKVIPYEC